MPIWLLEPDGGSNHLLVSSATLCGANFFVEALRVEDEDDPRPFPAVRVRFARWAAAAGESRPLAPVHLPGRDGCFVVFAASAPLLGRAKGRRNGSADDDASALQPPRRFEPAF